MSKRGLGKGLDALFATSSVALAKQQAANQAQTLSNDGALQELAVSQLQSGKYQPRKDIADEALAELTESIRAQGIIQPIIVRELTNSHFEIIAGERRWRAARQAGLKQVPCIVKSVDDRATMAIALIENIQREDLNVMEEAQALERLQSEFSLTHQQLAQAVGKSRTAVSNLLRLNQLATEVKHLVETKQIEMGHARALLALPTEQQLAIAQIVVSKALTVRETEALVKKQLEPQIEAKKVTKNPAVEAIENRLSEQFGTPVAISKQKNGKGKIVISFDQDHELQQILDKIGQ
ncbi:TPA: ParB/RepB/Spo0J family partition protein [Photobacterium damselae]